MQGSLSYFSVRFESPIFCILYMCWLSMDGGSQLYCLACPVHGFFKTSLNLIIFQSFGCLVIFRHVFFSMCICKSTELSYIIDKINKPTRIKYISFSNIASLNSVTLPVADVILAVLLLSATISLE